MKNFRIFLLLILTIFHTNIYSSWFTNIFTYIVSFITSSKETLQAPFIKKFNQNNPYRYTQANVRIGSDLPFEEKLFLEKRQKNTHYSLEKFLNKQSPKDLRIAFCASGGGYRAMIFTLGCLIGAQEIGLLDCTTYMSGLSGSTWTLGSWIQTNSSLTDLKKIMQINLSKNPRLKNNGLPLPNKDDADQIDEIINNFICKVIFNKEINSVDLYGSIIINDILAPLQTRQLLKLSEQRKIIENGNSIFPIYTAIEPKGDLNYQWYEFTPYEVGSTYLNAFIPSWSFAREFNAGKSTGLKTNQIEYEPEENLGFLFGIFGSAYTVSIEEICNILDLENKIAQKIKPLPLSLIKHLIKFKIDDEKRFKPATIKNFTKNLSSNPIQSQNEITLVDAGINFNLPFPPLLRSERNIDIIFVLDASQDVINAPELKKAQEYAQKNNLKFPKIDYKNIEKNSINIFMDSDKSVPTVIYMPRIKDNSLPANNVLKNFDPEICTQNGCCSTFNFSYKQEEFEQLCELGRFNVVENKEKIKSALLKKLEIN